jgi:trehalose-phosphatase
MLDYDGTLAPFRINPHEAAPFPGARDALNAIMAAGHTHVVIVSGRWTKDLVPLLGLEQRPDIWGSHAWEQLKANGEYEIARITEGALKQLVTADDWAADIETRGGRCERKPAGLAIHWRGLPANQVADIRQTAFENWRMQELYTHLQWHDFDGGIELRAPGRNKGDAVNAVLAEAGTDCAAAYLGDDLSDESAFKAIRGRGISVLVRPKYRPTAADFWIRPPEDLLGFLADWQHACKGRR